MTLQVRVREGEVRTGPVACWGAQQRTCAPTTKPGTEITSVFVDKHTVSAAVHPPCHCCKFAVSPGVLARLSRPPHACHYATPPRDKPSPTRRTTPPPRPTVSHRITVHSPQTHTHTQARTCLRRSRRTSRRWCTPSARYACRSSSPRRPSCWTPSPRTTPTPPPPTGSWTRATGSTSSRSCSCPTYRCGDGGAPGGRMRMRRQDEEEDEEAGGGGAGSGAGGGAARVAADGSRVAAQRRRGGCSGAGLQAGELG